jgi:hypothetical protein
VPRLSTHWFKFIHPASHRLQSGEWCDHARRHLFIEKEYFLFVSCVLNQQLPSHVCPRMTGDEGFISYVYLPIHAPNDSR